MSFKSCGERLYEEAVHHYLVHSVSKDQDNKKETEAYLTATILNIATLTGLKEEDVKLRVLERAAEVVTRM